MGFAAETNALTACSASLLQLNCLQSSDSHGASVIPVNFCQVGQDQIGMERERFSRAPAAVKEGMVGNSVTQLVVQCGSKLALLGSPCKS